MEVNGGATSSMGYEVYLTRPDMPTSEARVARLYDAVRNESAYGVNLQWESASELSLQYLSAKTALVIVPVWRSGDSAVRVVLYPGSKIATWRNATQSRETKGKLIVQRVSTPCYYRRPAGIGDQRLGTLVVISRIVLIAIVDLAFSSEPKTQRPHGVPPGPRQLLLARG